MKQLLTILFLGCCLHVTAAPDDLSSIIIDETSLEGYTIFHQPNLQDVVKQTGSQPIFIFGNGGCSRSSKPYLPMITEIVNQGYIVVAIGKVEMPPRPAGNPGAPVDFSKSGVDDNMVDAIDWFCENNANPESEYYHCADVFHIAVGGHSCGGAQAIRVSYDPRVTTSLILNSGMGDMSMAGATPQSVLELHAPILYLIGGPDDVAYPNAAKDVERISNVPVAQANFPVGHGGTYNQPKGGILTEVAIQWLDWQLKGKKEASKFFTDDKYRAKNYPTCVFESKRL